MQAFLGFSLAVALMADFESLIANNAGDTGCGNSTPTGTGNTLPYGGKRHLGGDARCDCVNVPTGIARLLPARFDDAAHAGQTRFARHDQANVGAHAKPARDLAGTCIEIHLLESLCDSVDEIPR